MNLIRKEWYLSTVVLVLVCGIIVLNYDGDILFLDFVHLLYLKSSGLAKVGYNRMNPILVGVYFLRNYFVFAYHDRLHDTSFGLRQLKSLRYETYFSYSVAEFKSYSKGLLKQWTIQCGFSILIAVLAAKDVSFIGVCLIGLMEMQLVVVVLVGFVLHLAWMRNVKLFIVHSVNVTLALMLDIFSDFFSITLGERVLSNVWVICSYVLGMFLVFCFIKIRKDGNHD